MGLAAAKNKRKLGNDPNNTRWSRNTESYGQRLLRSQGWEPGQYLGAKDAAHAEWHTEASTSHIRVVLKDDNLGLGAKRNNGDECTGLDAFQHLLGRLNGKSEETLESEKKVREDMKLNLYVERKLGTIRFVSGGWLVGDDLTEKPEKKPESQSESKAGSSVESSESDEPESKSAGKRSKKRKTEETVEEDGKKSSKKDKSKKRKTDTQTDTEDATASKTEKKRKSKKRKAGDVEGALASEVAQSLPSDADTSAVEKKKSKKERKEKKEKKKKERRSKKEYSQSTADTGDDIEREKKRRKSGSKSASAGEGSSEPSATIAQGSAVSTPSGSGTSTPIMGSSRYLARQRFIAQKRMAFTDSAALNQIFMIKS